MNLREELLKEHSKANALHIAGWIDNDPALFAQLIDLFLHDEYRVVQRASWIVSIIAEKHREIVIPYLKQMVERMLQPALPVAVKRNVVRVLQFIDIPEDLHGEVMNTCFDFLANPAETIAVRAFSMTILDNLSKIYPEIRQELVMILEDQLEHDASAGFRSRAKKVLKKGR